MNNMKNVYIDFETYSEADIGNVGAWKYCEHPSLDVICLAYGFDDDPNIRIYRQYEGDELPYELFDAIEDGYVVNAWNVSFEYSVWQHWCVKRGWPDVPLISWFDTMAKAAAHSLPLGLMNCCEALKLPDEYHKHAYGAEALRKLAIPQKDGKRIFPSQVPQVSANLYSYCKQDVVAERHISNLLAPLVPFEKDFWHIDQTINRRGIPVDTHSARKIRDRVVIEMEKANANLPKLTNNRIDRISQTARIVAFCQESGIKIDNCQAQTVDKVLDYVEKHPEKVQEKHKNAIAVLTIRKFYGKTATGKYDKILDCADENNRVKFTMLYHGAHTGRWAGRLIQPHNFFKPTINKKCDTDHFVDSVSNRDIDCVEAIYQPYIHAAASATRMMIAAPENKTFYIGDYNAIEARCVFWLAQDEVGLSYYHQGKDPYCEMASKIFKRPITKKDEHERFVGKQVVLGAGYGLSAQGFVRTLKEQWNVTIAEDVAKEAISAYREVHNKVVKCWYEVERAAFSAIQNPDKTFTYLNMRFIKPSNRDFFYIFLPSGRYIAFPEPKIVNHKTSWGEMKPTISFKIWDNKWIRSTTYGGKLVENIVQGASRDVMAVGMLEAEFAGYQIAFTVHDELVFEIPKENCENIQKELDRILQTSPVWAKELPIKIESELSTRYKKA